MLRTWLVYSVSLFATVIFFLFYKMWVAWYLLIALLILPFISLILCLIAGSKLGFEVDAPVNPHIGNKSFIKLKIWVKATYFSFVRVEFIVNDYMGGTTKKVLIPIYDNGTTLIPVDTTHCGAFSYKLSNVAVYDPFGFFRRNLRANTTHEVVVKPVPLMPEFMPDVFGFKAKNLRKAKQPNSEIYDIREYQPGDSIKTIHWKISAKKDKILIKEPLEEYGGHSRILLKLTEDRTTLDEHLGQILFTSRFFLDREITHKIRILPPDSSEIAFDVESSADLERALQKILRIRIPPEASHAN